jgi:nucleoside-diphosphate-sugar epimerase
LRGAGYPTRALIRPQSKRAGQLAGSVDTRIVDLADRDALADELDGVGALVYCAGSVRGARYEDFVAANITGLRNAAEALARQSEPPPLLLISSLAASQPQLSFYARSKAEGERVLAALPEHCTWTVLRPPPVYGPGDREVLPLFKAIRRGLAPITGPPGQRISLIHVTDLARAVVAWAAVPQACAGKIFAIDDGTPNGYGWPDIIAAVRRGPVLRLRVSLGLVDVLARLNAMTARAVGYAPMLTPGKVGELWHSPWLCDNAAFSAATGWSPNIRLSAGVTALFRGSG